MKCEKCGNKPKLPEEELQESMQSLCALQTLFLACEEGRVPIDGDGMYYLLERIIEPMRCCLVDGDDREEGGGQ